MVQGRHETLSDRHPARIILHAQPGPPQEMPSDERDSETLAPVSIAQSGAKHVTVNEAASRLDCLVQLSMISANQDIEPADAGDGDTYILPAGASGPSSSSAASGQIAHRHDGAWQFISPQAGHISFFEDNSKILIHTGLEWQVLGGTLGAWAPDRFGVNAAPDTTNRFIVKSDAELLSHDDVTPGTGDARKVINKATAGHTASFLFQSGWMGKAEIGLIGDDSLQVRVSADGTSFQPTGSVRHS